VKREKRDTVLNIKAVWKNMEKSGGKTKLTNSPKTTITTNW